MKSIILIVALLATVFVGLAVGSEDFAGKQCNEQACCERLQKPNMMTGNGYMEYWEDCKANGGGLHCVEQTGCRLCYNPKAMINAVSAVNLGDRPVCGRFQQSAGTSNDDGAATSNDDGAATSNDGGAATSNDNNDGSDAGTSNDNGAATSNEDGAATSNEDGASTSNDNGAATSNDDNNNDGDNVATSNDNNNNDGDNAATSNDNNNNDGNNNNPAPPAEGEDDGEDENLATLLGTEQAIWDRASSGAVASMVSIVVVLAVTVLLMA